MELRRAAKAVCRLEIFIKVVQGEPFKTGDATGFFYTKAGTLFLITNKHVVLEKGRHEDMLRVFPPEKKKPIDLNLRDAAGNALWKSHPYEDVDVVALGVPRNYVKNCGKEWGKEEYNKCFQISKNGAEFNVWAFSSDDLLREKEYLPGEKIPLASFAYVLGYPLAFHDKGYPDPMVRGATVATIPWHNLKIKGRERKPCFLIDATLHDGMSGSPVVSSPVRKTQDPHCYGDVNLYGVYSGEWIMGVEQLGLQNVWHAKLIEEILREPISP